MTPALARRLHGDRGSLALVELPYGTLLVIAAALVVLTAPTWVERHSAATAAADEAARAVVLADTWDQGAADARAFVDQIAANYDLAAGDLSLELSGDLARGATVTAYVTVEAPAVALPLVGYVGSYSWTVSTTEDVDRYRSFAAR